MELLDTHSKRILKTPSPKVWVSEEKGNDGVIAITEEGIIKADPKAGEANNYRFSIEKGVTLSGMYRIPWSYIRQVRMEEGKPYIQVFHGKGASEDHLRITDEQKRNEVFGHLKTQVNDLKYGTVQHSKWRAVRKPLIAFSVLLAIYIAGAGIAIANEGRNNIELGGSYGNLLMALGSLGIVKLSVLFAAFEGIAIWAILKRIRTRPVIHLLWFEGRV